MPPSEARTSSLADQAAVVTLATALSRITGFVRVIVVAGAMGTTFLANTYQTANTAPNLVFELVAAGVLTSVFVPIFVEHLVKGRREEGWQAANALTSVAVVGLMGLTFLLVLGAPLVMKVLTLGVSDPNLRAGEIALGSSLLRLFAPQILFYGAGMIMTSALHARRKFAVPAFAPILNNLVVIAVYLTYAAMRGDRPPTVDGITPGETLLLGAGTTMGVVAMTLCLLPQLMRLGWKWRFDFAPSHPAVKRAASLGVWALGYAGGYQAGLIVVLLLANRIQGGVAAYQWAYTFFYLPHALFAVSIFHVLFTAMSENAARGELSSIGTRLEQGTAMLLFILIPIAGFFVVAGESLARVTLDYGAMTGAGAELVARTLAAFALGLPLYSAFLVLTRASYALGDTKTPALVNAASIVAASVAGVFLFALLPDRWSVAGLALGHSFGFALGALGMGRAVGRRVGGFWGSAARAALTRAVVGTGAAVLAMSLAGLVLPDGSKLEALLTLMTTTGVGAAAYIGVMVALHSPELARATGLVRRSGR